LRRVSPSRSHQRAVVWRGFGAARQAQKKETAVFGRSRQRLGCWDAAASHVGFDRFRPKAPPDATPPLLDPAASRFAGEIPCPHHRHVEGQMLAAHEARRLRQRHTHAPERPASTQSSGRRLGVEFAITIEGEEDLRDPPPPRAAKIGDEVKALIRCLTDCPGPFPARRQIAFPAAARIGGRCC